MTITRRIQVVRLMMKKAAHPWTNFMVGVRSGFRFYIKEIS